MKSIIALSIALLLAACDHDGSTARVVNSDGVQEVSVPEPAPFMLLAFGAVIVLIATRKRR